MTLGAGAGYARFVPARLVRASMAGHPAPHAPTAECVRGTVVFADVVGYTQLTEWYAHRGPAGIEELSALLGRFFGGLEGLVTQFGGEIMSYSGDSMLALWAAESITEQEALRRAEAFARHARADLGITEAGAKAPLGLKIARVSGEFQLANLGGFGERWYYVVIGAPLMGIARQMQGTLEGEAPDEAPCSTAEPEKPAAPIPQVLPLATSMGLKSLRRFIPAPVLDQLDNGQKRWMSEFRSASILSCGWGPEAPSADEGLERLQATVLSVQHVVARFEGELTRIVVDDKGANAQMVWGLPGQQHEDDPVRAVRAGLAIQAMLRSQGLEAAVGIATGHVLCALNGGEAFCEYGPSGNAVNLAARLMMSGMGPVVCDAATVGFAQRRIAFEPIGRLQLKGRQLPCDAFLALDRAPPDEPELRSERRQSVLVGRRSERARLLHELDLPPSAEDGVVLIVGAPGMGKTSLLRELVKAAKDADMCCLVGCADEIEKQTLYFPWRAVLSQLLRTECADETLARRLYVERVLAPHPHAHAWLALLNSLVPLGFMDTPITMQMSEQARAEATAEIVIRLLEPAAARRPVLLVLDDVQWMDSISWHLAYQIRRRLPMVRLVLSMRTGKGPAAATGEPAAMLDRASRLELQALSYEDTAALLCIRLGVNTVAPAVVSKVFAMSAGNPLFSEEVALAMRQTGEILLLGDHCAPGEVTGKIDRGPVAMERLIWSRMDLLSPSHKATLKVASVLGLVFTESLLAAMLPTLDSVALRDQLAALALYELVVPDANADDGIRRYSFKHGLTRDAAYALTTDAERRDLHERIAQWHEHRPFEEQGPFYPLLAYHWEKAGNDERSREYLFLAGKQAIDRFANREGFEFLGRCLVKLERKTDEKSVSMRASCEWLLGTALLWMGLTRTSGVHLQDGLALMGFAVPRTPARQVFSTLGQVAALVLRRWAGFRVKKSALTAKDREMAMALLRLGHVAYFLEDARLMSFTCVRCLDLATRADDSPESALMFAALAAGAGSVPLHGVAVRYGDRALGIAERLADASVSAQTYLFSAIYRVGIGDWTNGLNRVKRATDLSLVSGDNRRREECFVIQGFLELHSGDLAAAMRSYAQAADAARLRDDQQTCAWGLLGMSRVLILQGRFDDAARVLEDVATVLDEATIKFVEAVKFVGNDAGTLVPDPLTSMELQGQLALVSFRRGDISRSLAEARQGLRRAQRSRPTSFATLTGLSGVAESLIDLCALASQGALREDVPTLRREAAAALGVLSSHARIFPIGRPRLLLLRARHLHASGRVASARALYREALAVAQRLTMPYEKEKAAMALEGSAPARQRSC